MAGQRAMIGDGPASKGGWREARGGLQSARSATIRESALQGGRPTTIGDARRKTVKLPASVARRASKQRRKAASGKLIAGRQRCGWRHGCGVQRAVTKAIKRGASLWRCLVALRLRTVSTLVRHGEKSRLRRSAVAGVAVDAAGGSVVITRR